MTFAQNCPNCRPHRLMSYEGNGVFFCRECDNLLTYDQLEEHKRKERRTRRLDKMIDVSFCLFIVLAILFLTVGVHLTGDKLQ